MLYFCASLRKFKAANVLRFTAMFLLPTGLILPNSGGYGLARAQDGPPPPRTPGSRPQQPQPEATQPQASGAPGSSYDKAIFQKIIPSGQLAFLNQFSGVAAKDVIRDKQFRKLMKSFVPDCIFH
jgi:hypothetical protein